MYKRRPSHKPTVPCLIFAGAGSGKTRVLTHRIALLLGERKVAPDRILAVTFTNKAAGEMKTRLERMVGAAARDLWVGTFHSMCVRMLRRDGSKAGISPSFAIIDEADQRQLIKDILDDLDYDERQLAPGACLHEISKAKNNLIWPDKYHESQTSFLGERMANVYTEYERRLRESNSLDFDDLIVRTIDLLERDASVREKYQRNFEYILVDEYQDVNVAQYRLIAILGTKHKNVTVVGDDDQSIYSWRGSDYRMILRFEARLPRRQGLQARRELSLDAAHSRCRQRAGFKQQGPRAEEALHAPCRGRGHHALRRGDRA